MGREGSGGITVLAMSLLVGPLTAWVSGFGRVMLQLLPNPRTLAAVAGGQEGGPRDSTGPLPMRVPVHAQATGLTALEMKMGQDGIARGWRCL